MFTFAECSTQVMLYFFHTTGLKNEKNPDLSHDSNDQKLWKRNSIRANECQYLHRPLFSKISDSKHVNIWV